MKRCCLIGLSQCTYMHFRGREPYAVGEEYRREGCYSREERKKEDWGETVMRSEHKRDPVDGGKYKQEKYKHQRKLY